ncbi:MAG TPA: methyltransferase domain-containing protein [Gemmatimonadales bacterium]
MERYRRAGPDTTTRHLLAALAAVDLSEAALLDVGAGIGVLHHELLGDRFASATHVEAAPAAIAEARAETERRGHGDRVRFIQGDFVDLADDIAPADVVTLDRVICCYPDYISLLTRSADKARRYYGLSAPRDRWYVRLVTALENLGRRVTGNAFRTFVHPTAAMDRLLHTAGFTLRSRRATIAWEASLYERKASPAGLSR